MLLTISVDYSLSYSQKRFIFPELKEPLFFTNFRKNECKKIGIFKPNSSIDESQP